MRSRRELVTTLRHLTTCCHRMLSHNQAADDADLKSDPRRSGQQSVLSVAKFVDEAAGHEA